MPTAGQAAVLFRKKKQVDRVAAAVLESSSLAGAFLSGYFAHLFLPKALTFAPAVLGFAAGTSMLTRLDWLRERGAEHYQIRLGQGMPLSFLIGIVSRLTGAVGGFLKIPLMVRLSGMPISIAFGSSALMVSLTAPDGLLGHLATGSAIWHEPLLLSAFILVGSQTGPWLAVRSSPVAMRKRFTTQLFVLACLVMANSFFLTPSGELALSFLADVCRAPWKGAVS